MSAWNTYGYIKQDMVRLLPNADMKRVFDVGGNVGQTAAALNKHFPGAEVWTFEPVEASYHELQERARTLQNVRCFNLALGSRPRNGLVTARGTSPTNHLVAGAGTAPTQEVEIVTGDDFCQDHGVDTIDYLKIDTEGHELEVLRGFHGMLGRFAIDVLELEVGMNWENSRQIPIERVKGYVEPIGYYVFRLYEQVSERRGHPHLRRVNAVFISRPIIEANIRAPREVAADAPLSRS
jgi:FkbM family methyltransferase